MGSEYDDRRPAPEAPSLARVWDALQGGKDNRVPDRAEAARLEQAVCLSELVAANADFRRRALEHLAGPGRVTQFIDCGPGFPNPASASTILHQFAPEARVLYADNDPLVLAHCRALLEADDRVRVVDADIFDPKAVLHDDAVRTFFDWTAPIALIHTATLPHYPDDRRPVDVMRGYVEALPAGSYTVVSHFATPDQDSLRRMAGIAEAALVDGPIGSGWFRTLDQIAALFPDQELLDPGLVPCDDWRPTDDTDEHGASIRRCLVAAIGRIARPATK
ncbi:SAM-dependent methyltransferase [Kribbella sp. NPDC059898]|uniref:SAM-dependent methyltransferase n=1 Tax=Kribbella sp. NPDC059898 TaxID=3346995 RepID=UPI0036666B54